MQLLSCLRSLPSSFLKLNYKEMLHPGAIAATYIPHMMGWNLEHTHTHADSDVCVEPCVYTMVAAAVPVPTDGMFDVDIPAERSIKALGCIF